MGVDIFNLVEGVFWIGLGVWVLVTRRVVRQRRHIVLAIGLVMFGISDFVEMASGAWWEPWWLLVWKGICVGVFILFFIHLYFERRRQWERT